MFTINNGNKKISAIHNEKHYAVGFKNIMLAKHIQYNLYHNTKDNIDPIVYINKYQRGKLEIDLSFATRLLNKDIFTYHEDIDDIGDISSLNNTTNNTMAFYTEAELYMQKIKPYPDQHLDTPYHLEIVPKEEFMCYPIDKLIGVVLPEEVIDEDDTLLILRCQLIDPFFIPEYFKQQLSKNFDKN